MKLKPDKRHGVRIFNLFGKNAWTESKIQKRSHAVYFITTRLAPVPRFPKNDDMQTPMRGHPVFIAQRVRPPLAPGVSVGIALD
jgi:hypothetical protein